MKMTLETWIVQTMEKHVVYISAMIHHKSSQKPDGARKKISNVIVIVLCSCT
jgi:hypothetical protein